MFRALYSRQFFCHSQPIWGIYSRERLYATDYNTRSITVFLLGHLSQWRHLTCFWSSFCSFQSSTSSLQMFFCGRTNAREDINWLYVQYKGKMGDWWRQDSPESQSRLFIFRAEARTSHFCCLLLLYPLTVSKFFHSTRVCPSFCQTFSPFPQTSSFQSGKRIFCSWL